MSRFALEEFAATDLANELPIARGDLTADGNCARTTLNFHAFKGVVIEVHRMRLRGNFSLIVWIVNNEVSVSADLDGALAREQAEDFCGVGARRGDELMQ